MSKFVYLIIIQLLFFIPAHSSVPVPKQPTESIHPGSTWSPYSFKREVFKVGSRKVWFFHPDPYPENKVPVLVFGHGRFVSMSGYREMFEHFSKKGIAVIFPQYDTGSRDSDFTRMANDYIDLVDFSLNKYAQYLDKEKVVFAGHSNGARVSLMAAGLINSSQADFRPAAVVTAAMSRFAGVKALKSISPDVPVTFIVGDKDTKTPFSVSLKNYSELETHFRQIVTLKSYTTTSKEYIATHGSIRNLTFGGRVVTPLHYYGYWKIIGGVLYDVIDGNNLTNIYAYGSKRSTTGIHENFHDIHED